MIVNPGSTDVSHEVRAMTATGPLTGKVAADFSIWYRRDGAKVPIALSDLTAIDDAHAAGGMYEIDDGWYRLDLPDAACAADAHRVAIGGSVSGGVVISAPITIDQSWLGANRTLTSSGASVATAADGSTHTFYSGDEITIAITGLGSLASRTDVQYAVKLTRRNPDASAQLFITESAGLVRVGGAAIASPVVATDASLTVDDEDAGDITIVVKAAASILMAPNQKRHVWGVKLFPTGSGPRTLSEGIAHVIEDVVQATE